MHVPTNIKDAAFKVPFFDIGQTSAFNELHLEIQIPRIDNINIHTIPNKLALVYDNDSYKFEEDKQIRNTKDNNKRDNLLGK